MLSPWSRGKAPRGAQFCAKWHPFIENLLWANFISFAASLHSPTWLQSGAFVIFIYICLLRVNAISIVAFLWQEDPILIWCLNTKFCPSGSRVSFMSSLPYSLSTLYIQGQKKCYDYSLWRYCPRISQEQRSSLISVFNCSCNCMQACCFHWISVEIPGRCLNY